MTLIATAISDDSVVQVVDRRITRNGVLYDDLANKALCGNCADSTFSLCYTGLMMTPVRTDEWLANFLAADRVLLKPFPAVLDVLAKALTAEFERFRHLPGLQRRLTLALAGFGPPGPFAATVTNQEDEQGLVLAEPEEAFRISCKLRNEKEMRRLDMVFHGAEAAIDEDLRRVIEKVRRALSRKSGARIASALVAVVRRAAKHSKHGQLISPHCVSMVQTRGSAQIAFDDHFLGQRRKAHLPHFVSPSGSFKHIWIEPG
jgi:hypothetical protein